MANHPHDAANSVDAIPSVLRELAPPVCVECDYSLIGLPQGTRCPECGLPNDPSIITVQGWSNESVATMRPRDLWVDVISTGAVVAWLIVSGVTIRWQSLPIPVVLIGGFWLVRNMLPLFRRWNLSADAAFPVQLRLGAHGFEQRLGPGLLKLTRWHRHMRLSMHIRKRGLQWLRVRWAMHHYARTLKSDLIDFQFETSVQQARALQRQIERWITHAGATTLALDCVVKK